MSRKPFVVVKNRDARFLVRRPKVGPWPDFSNDLNEALKFRTPEEADEWLKLNKVRHVRLFWYHR